MEAPLQNAKFLNILPPAVINDNSGYSTTSIDTRGFSRCMVVVQLGALDIAVAVLKIQESNDDGSTDNYADVTGLVYGTSTDISGSTSALPAADKDNGLYAFDVDLRGRDRYLKLVFTAGDGALGTYASAFAILSNPETSCDTATQRGFNNVLRA